MRLDIQQLLAEGNGTMGFDFTFPVTDMADFDNTTAGVKGVLRNHGGYIELTATTVVEGFGVCARCGGLFPYKKQFDTVRPVAKSLVGDENDEYIIADEDGFLSLIPVFEEEMTLQLPTKLLCTEDCKGLCVKCGANLNKVSCGCVTKEIDPRLEVLKALLDNG